MTELIDIATRVAGWANDGEDVEAFVVHERETEVRAYEGEIESLTAAESQGIGVQVVIDGRQGYAYAGTLDDSALRETLQEARDNAQFTEPDESNGLAVPDGVTPVELDLYDESLASFATDDKIALAIELERATRAADPRISGIESAEYVDILSDAAVANSAGLSAVSRETGCYLSAYSLAEADGETQTGFGFSIGRGPSELDPAVASADAAERATRLLGAVKPPTQRLTVVLDPWVTAQMLGIIGHTLTGDAVQRGRSLFADRLGDSVAMADLVLVDDGTNPDAFTASTVDGEGLATRPISLIKDGVLQGFLHNSYTARRGRTVSTGSAVRGGFKSGSGVGAHALALRPGNQTQAELIAGIDDGLLVQGVAGLHSGVNPVSGDFSAGAEGLRIRNGELAEPVREITIASTIQRLLLDIRAIGSDLEWLPMAAAGVSLVVDDITMSGA
ncbi:MAG: TldD/PmbA family protein [Acidimicrobiales bacterium]|jgi:PmbA protein|nr:TldD/PmbA family protein [Acidimicrobiales bacterium]